jgi:hypothetical protein
MIELRACAWRLVDAATVRKARVWRGFDALLGIRRVAGCSCEAEDCSCQGL